MQLLVVTIVLVAFTGLVGSEYCPPTPEFFECDNERCILAAYCCDGDPDCGDGSDEPPQINPVKCPACDSTQFRCPNGRCFPKSYMCDGDNDCGDRWDEPENPADCPACDVEQHRCSNGRCIDKSWVCDGIINCSDRSDEPQDPEQCPPCQADDFRCDNGRCWPSIRVCDGRNNCGDGSDERQDCPPCPSGQFTCAIGGCIRESYLCNKQNDCVDWSDETEENCPCAAGENRCGQITPPPGEWQAPGECMPSEFWCDEDGIRDCPDGSDESNCSKADGHINAFKNVHEIRQQFRKNSLKEKKQQKKSRNWFSDNPRFWQKVKKAKSSAKKESTVRKDVVLSHKKGFI